MNITDEYVLAGNRINVKQAAKYIGMTPDKLTWLMQQDAINGTKEVTFGFARKAKGKSQWNYTIIASQLYQYKKGSRLERDEEIAQAKEIIRHKDKQIERQEMLIYTLAKAIADLMQPKEILN